jgi:hypothetical protein
VPGHDFTACGKSPSDNRFWVAQRFSPAKTGTQTAALGRSDDFENVGFP